MAVGHRETSFDQLILSLIPEWSDMSPVMCLSCAFLLRTLRVCVSMYCEACDFRYKTIQLTLRLLNAGTKYDQDSLL